MPVARRDSYVVQIVADELEELCVRDLLAAFKLTDKPGPWPHLARIPARRFAAKVRHFDNLAGRDGLRAAGQYILNLFTREVQAEGVAHLPRTGPLIVASNHPGMTDAMALWTSIPRNDLKIIAADRDLLRCLPNIRPHLILMTAGSISAFREAKRHLLGGGCLLTFPAGKIEPDPTVRAGAQESLRDWSSGTVLLAQRVPGTVLVPAFVQGVISREATQHPLLRYLQDEKDRDWAAATLQILLPKYRKLRVSVKYGHPVQPCHEKLIEATARLVHRSAGANRKRPKTL